MAKQNKTGKSQTDKPKQQITQIHEEPAITLHGKIIVIKTSMDISNEVAINILTDGSIKHGLEPTDDKVIINLIGKDISWTQIHSMVEAIKKLQAKGAGKVERYDAFHPGAINPEFNLRHSLIKFNIR